MLDLHFSCGMLSPSICITRYVSFRARHLLPANTETPKLLNQWSVDSLRMCRRGTRMKTRQGDISTSCLKQDLEQNQVFHYYYYEEHLSPGLKRKALHNTTLLRYLWFIYKIYSAIFFQPFHRPNLYVLSSRERIVLSNVLKSQWILLSLF